MTHRWDDFSKSLAEGSIPRRESLRLLGAALAGAVLSPLALGTALAGPKRMGKDPCKTFCKCSTRKQQNACLAACRACTGATSRLCGSCGGGFVCTDIATDVYNCGGCYNSCRPGPYEEAACVGGRCEYFCAEGALRCGGECIPVLWDPDNCGACGNVCGESTPHCDLGECTINDCPAGQVLCGGRCTSLMSDPDNCGACGVRCAPLDYCDYYTCAGIYYGDPGF